MAQPELTRELLRRLPKAELHCHLDGSLRPSTLLELGREYGTRMPASDPQSLGEYMLVDDARNLEDYLARFHVTLSVMQRAEAIERIAYELMEDAWRDGIRYIEVRYSPVLNVEEGLTTSEVLEAGLRGLARGERDFNIVGRVIVCALRHMSPDVSLELARLAVAFRDRGVVAFDLAGGERGNPASLHAQAFMYAREHDLAVTVHAGEGDGAHSIRQAVHLCVADRIGHGTRLEEDASLLEYVNDRRIPIEVCLTSNVQTRAAATFEAHPLRRYFDRGLVVVPCTDNRLMSGISLTDEYHRAARHLDFGWEELKVLATNGFSSAFLPWDKRRALLERVQSEIVAMETEA